MRIDQNNRSDKSINDNNHNDNNSDDYGNDVVSNRTDFGTESQFPTMSATIK